MNMCVGEGVACDTKFSIVNIIIGQWRNAVP